MNSLLLVLALSCFSRPTPDGAKPISIDIKQSLMDISPGLVNAESRSDDASPISIEYNPTAVDIKPTGIVGGTSSPGFKYPWIASLQQRGVHFCGGTLLNPTTVLTAGIAN